MRRNQLTVLSSSGVRAFIILSVGFGSSTATRDTRNPVEEVSHFGSLLLAASTTMAMVAGGSECWKQSESNSR